MSTHTPISPVTDHPLATGAGEQAGNRGEVNADPPASSGRFKPALRFIATRLGDLLSTRHIRMLGGSAALKYFWFRTFGFLKRAPYELHPRGLRFPLVVRPRTSDLAVFRQIFVECEYACLDDLEHAGLVIDCGANVGYSSAWFLSRFPQCRVVAVEPDGANFQILQKNLAPYRERATTLEAGVWSHSTPLTICEEPYRDGRAWARQVRPTSPGEESTLSAIDIGSILAGADDDHISILKIDVEGAEAVVFSRNYEPWLEKTRAMVIELHDDSMFGPATPVFFSAIANQDFVLSTSGELTVCRRE